MKTAALAQRQSNGPEPSKGGGNRRPFFAASRPGPQAIVDTVETQARLRLGQPGDRYEVEADRVADDVVDGRGATHGSPGLAAGVTPITQRVEDEEEAAQAKGEDEEKVAKTEEEEESAQRREEEEEEAQAKEEKEEKETAQRQEEEEAAQPKEDEEEEVQAKAEGEQKAAKAEEEEESAQRKEEEEEEAQAKEKEEEEVARAEEEEEKETAQRQEEEEAAQPKEDEEEEAQTQPEEEEPTQARTANRAGLSVTEEVSRQIRAARGRGNPLPGPVRARMEAQFGADFSGVRIHTDSMAVQLSKALRAQAFTRGSDIFFNQGRFAPGSRAGQHLLAHELTHTVQQGAVEPQADTVRLAPDPSQDDGSYEVRPEIAEAVRLARGEIGKVNAQKAGGDGKRIGWDRLIEYFNTAFGGPVIHQKLLERVIIGEKLQPDGTKKRMDVLPSWCGIFTWWAMKKAGLPIPDWKVGAPPLSALKPRAQGELPRKGDIAIDVVPYNHFAMLSGLESTKDAEGKPQKLIRVATINGNTAGENNLGGQVQEKWHELAHWDHFLDPVGKLNLPPGPMVRVRRERDEAEAAPPAPAAPAPEAKRPEPEPRPELAGLDAPVAEPMADVPGAPPEPDLSLPPPVDPGPSDTVAKVEKVDLGGSSDQATTAFIDSSPSSMALSQRDFGPAVDGKMQGEQTDLAENPPVIEAKTSGAVDAPITGPNDLPIPGQTGIGDGKASNDPGAIDEVKGETPKPFQGNANREKDLEKEDKAGSLWDYFKQLMRKYTLGIYTRDDGIATSAGPDQKVDLTGDADTGKMDTQRGEGTQTLVTQRDEHTNAFRNHPGQSNIQPRMLNEQRPAKLKTEPNAKIESESDTQVRKYAAAPIPENIRAKADARIAAKLTPNLAESRRQTTEAADKRDTDKDAAVNSARAEAEAINTKADTDQRNLVVSNRGEVAKLQGQGIGTAYDHVNQFSKDAATEQASKRKEVKDHVEKEEGAARKKLDEGETDAEAEKKRGEEEAARKKRELEKEQENDSWWDKVKSAVKKAVKAVTEAIDKVFTAVRNAVKTIIEKAKNAAIGLINKARNWVVNKLNDFRDWAKKNVDKYLKDSFPGLAKAINSGIDTVTDTAIDGVNAVADGAIAAVEFVADNLAAALDKVLATFQTALKTAVRVVGAVMTGDFAEALRAVIEGACEIAGIDPKPIFDFIDRAGKAVEKILDDPIGFIKQLFGAVGDGLGSFFKNIKKHMIQGVIGWLTGALSEVNLTGPFEFSLKGILKIVLEILGLTYHNIKAKVIKRYPKAEKIFAIIEKGAEIAGEAIRIVKRVFKEGPGALWDEIKKAMANLKEMVMGAIRNWIITTVIKEGIIWLISLTNPASALAKALKLLFDLVMFLVERIGQIRDFVMSVYNAVAAIASGNFKAVTKAVEDALSRSIPVLISLIASVLGLGGIAKKVKEVIEKITAPINRVIDKVVDKVVAFAKKMLAKVKAGAKKAKEKGKELLAKVLDWWREKKTFKSKDGGSHKLYYKGNGANAEMMVASDPITVGGFLLKKINSTDTPAAEKAVARAAASQYKTVLQHQQNIERLRKERAKLSGKANEDAKKDLSKRIGTETTAYRKALETLSGTLGKVNFEAESDLMVRTHVHAASGGDKAVEALPLTHLSGNTRGSPPGSADPPGWEHAKKLTAAGEDTWIRGHLVNDNLHGEGKNYNLVPITGSMNTTMSSRIEEPAKAAVGRKEGVFYYHAQAQLWGGSGEAAPLGRKITVNWGRLERIEGKEPKDWRKVRTGGGPVESTTRPSDEVKTAMTNINTAGRVNLQSAIGGGVTQNFVENYVMKNRTPPYEKARDIFLRLNPSGDSPDEVKRKAFVKQTLRAVMDKRLGFGTPT